MSQEARLKLRMQKELKLLLADPPHGTSFPFLSSNSNMTDLCSIDAQIEGPEETVYGKGIFKIKIQIPERYPLQPPIVTFATPIYHPNIDNGGRICLDILNLPPKGAWQPSLNISTVLISIRLLLGEPNPDDGLMCEASREYKYNRQAFDHKARSMTEKFATAGAGESSCSVQCNETKADSAMVLASVQGSDQESNRGASEFNTRHKRSLSISQKLSLDSTSSNKEKDADQKVPDHNLFLSGSVTQMESTRKRETEHDVLNEYNLLNNENVNGKGWKSSSESSDRCKDDFDNEENVDPNYLSSLCQHPASSGSSLDFTSSNKKKDAEQKMPNQNLCLSITQMESKRKREEENDVLNEHNLNNEKVNGKGKKLSLKRSVQCKEDFDNKENVDPNYLSSLCQHPASSGSSLSQASRNQQLDQQENSNSEKSSTKSSSKLCRSQKQPFGSMEAMQTCKNVKNLEVNLFSSASGTQMGSKRKLEKENDVLIEYNLNLEKVIGKGWKSSSKTSDRFKDDFDNKENVDPNYLSPLCRDQQLDQHEDGNSANSHTKSSSKLYQSLKQPLESMVSIQTCENVKNVLRTVEESNVDRTENISASKKSEKISLVGKKLSLGLKGSSQRPKVSNKENVLPLSKPQTPGKSVLGRKLSLVPSTQQLQQDCGPNQKQQSNQVVQRKQTDMDVKQKGKEEMEEESSISEKVVVLDSEESEGEEQTAPLRTRMPLASRKRLGRWRI